MKPDELKRSIKLSAMVYQAVEQFKHSGSFVLPGGFTLLTPLGKNAHPYLGYMTESKKQIVIAIRGTENVPELIKSLEYGQIPFPFVRHAGKTHKGLTHLYSSVLRKPILDLLKTKPATKTLWIAGHSIGGSLAVLCALDVSYNTKFKNPIVYTFGAPKTGDPRFADVFNKRIARCVQIVNRNDMAPLLPLSTRHNEYMHVKGQYPITFHNSGKWGPGSHKIENYFKNLAIRDPHYSRTLCGSRLHFCPI